MRRAEKEFGYRFKEKMKVRKSYKRDALLQFIITVEESSKESNESEHFY
jgi:hypothetical protein